MWSKLILASGFVAVTCISPVLSAPALEERGICDGATYGELISALRGYQPAQAFCSAVYRPRCVVINTKRQATTTTNAAAKRPASTTTTTTTTITTTNTRRPSTITATTRTVDKYCSALSKLKSNLGQAVTTVCSCLQPPPVRSCSHAFLDIALLLWASGTTFRTRDVHSIDDAIRIRMNR